jgi:deoxyribonuclease IV
MTLLFGTAGIPISTPNRSTANGIEHVRKLGLNAMELEFVHSINITKEKTAEIKKIATQNNISLSCHAPYYINLASTDKTKINASIQRIVKSAEILSLCGGKDVVFHAGYYMKRDKTKVYSIIKDSMKKIISKLKEKHIDVILRPEIAGKNSVFGSLDEIISLSKELPRTLPCIDFSHLYARTVGEYNNQAKFEDAIKKIQRGLGSRALRHMHIHYSGIAFGPSGEKHHQSLQSSKFNYHHLAKALKRLNCSGVAICESPLLEKDALLMKRIYDQIK